MKEVIEKEKQLTMEDILEIPEMSDWHADIRYIQTTPFSKLFPTKYRMMIEDSIKRQTFNAFKINAATPLKDVVSTVLSSLKDDISPELIVKMTQLIVDKWTQLSAEIQTYKDAEVFV